MRAATFFLSIALVISLFRAPAATGEAVTTLRLPEAVLSKILNDTVPIPIDRKDESIGGIITIKRISQLRLAEQSLSAIISLSATDLQVNTNVAGHQLRLKVGNVETDFGIAATLRYNRADRTLLMKPEVRPLGDPGQSSGNEVAILLAGLFNGKEFPIAIDRLQPIVTTTGNKELTIDLQLTDITIVPQALVLSFHPAVSTTIVSAP